MKKSLIALAFGTLALGMSEFVMMGILPDIARSLGVSIPEAGHLISAYALGVCFGAPLMVLVARKRPLKQILLALTAMIAAGNLCASLAPDYWSLLGLRFVSGLPHGAFFGVGSIVAERVADAETLRRDTIAVKVGDSISIAVLEDALVDANFTRVDFVYEPGQYSVRGGIVDVFSFSESKPYRIDFFGDEVDSIRRFNISSQLSADKLDRVEIIPNLNAGDGAAKVSFVQFAGDAAAYWFYDADYVLRRVNDIRRKTLADMERPEEIDRLMTSRNALLGDLANCRMLALRDNLPERPATAAVEFDTAPQPKFNKNFEMLADDMIRNSLRGYTTYILSLIHI